MQPIEQSLSAQARRHPWQGFPLQRQNRHFKVVTSPKLRLNPRSININDLQAQRWLQTTEIKILQTLLQPFTKTAALPAEQSQLQGLNRGLDHSRRG